jgi:hypothetical protein
MVLNEKREKTCLLIDIVVPDGSYINTKETEKPNKYRYLDIAVSRMWKLRTKIVPVINGAFGTIKKGLDHKFQLLPAHPSAIEMQITLMSTAHIMRTVVG